MTKPFFAWIDYGEVFDANVHNVEDLIPLDIDVQHKEGKFPTAAIVVKGPQFALLAPGRKTWGVLSYDVNGTAVEFFRGRLIALPTDIAKEAVTLNFVAEPEDYALQQHHVAQTLKTFEENYDPVMMDEKFRDDPTAILEGFSQRWHISRDLEVSTSDVLYGEDGTEVFTDDEMTYAGLECHVSAPPITAVEFDASVGYSQAGEGIIDFGTFSFSTLNGDALMSGWPKTGASLGGGWTVERGTAIDRLGVRDAYTVNYNYHYQNNAKLHQIGDTMSINVSATFPVTMTLAQFVRTPIEARLNRVVMVAFTSPDPDFHDVQPSGEKFNTFYAFPWVVDCSLLLRYAAGRDRVEKIRGTLVADLQSIITLPHAGTPAATEKLTVDGGDVSIPVVSYSSLTGLPFTPEPPPIIDPQRTSYFPTERGQRSIKYVINRASAILKFAARCVEVKFKCSFERVLALSCRKNINFNERRLGEVSGKITGYTIKWSGKDGAMYGIVEAGCAIGRGGFAPAQQGDPSYAAPGYMAPGYQYYYNQYIALALGDVSYSMPIDATTDDGMTFPLTVAQVVLRQEVNGTDPPALATIVANAAAAAGQTGIQNPSIDQQIAAHNAALAAAQAAAAVEFGIFFDLQLKPVDKAGFEKGWQLTLSTQQIMMMIDLGEGPSVGGAVPGIPVPELPPESNPLSPPTIVSVFDSL